MTFWAIAFAARIDLKIPVPQQVSTGETCCGTELLQSACNHADASVPALVTVRWQDYDQPPFASSICEQQVWSLALHAPAVQSVHKGSSQEAEAGSLGWYKPGRRVDCSKGFDQTSFATMLRLDPCRCCYRGQESSFSQL